MIFDQNVFNCLFLRFCKKCISPIKSDENFVSRFCALLWVEFFLVPEVVQFLEDSCLFWCMILRFSRTFRCWEPERIVLLLRFIRSEKIIWVGSQVRIPLWNHSKNCHIYWFDVLGLVRSDHGEFCNLCVCFNEIW